MCKPIAAILCLAATLGSTRAWADLAAPATAPAVRAPSFEEDPADPFATPIAPKGPTSRPSTFAPAAESPELMLFKDLPLIIAAGKRVQTQRDAAASVTVVTDDDISLFGYRSLAEVLRNQRGFYLNTDGLNWFLGVRGFLRSNEWNARVLVLVDGRPTREFVYGQTHLDQDFVVPMEAVKRVEIVRGPGSALYGSNAIFGVVNVVTKDGADLNGWLVRGQGGTQETARGAVLYGTRTNDGWDVLAGVTGLTSAGARDVIFDGVHDPEHNFGHVRDHDGEQTQSAFLKVKKGDVTATFDYETRLRDNRSAAYAVSFFEPGSMHEDRGNVTVRLDHEVNETQSFHAMVYYGHYNYRQQYTYPADPLTATPADRYVTQGNDDWIGEEFHYDWQVTPRFHLLAGAEATQAFYANQRDHDSLNGDVLNEPKSFNSAGAFAEGELKATEWLKLIAGARLDQVQRIDTQFSPRAAAIVTPNKLDTYKLLYGRSFRAPNLYELYYNSPGTFTPNPNLKPEVVDTFELVWEHQFKSGWRTSVGGFYWKMSDALQAVPVAPASENVQTRNVGSVYARGLELEAQRQWDNGARLRAYGTLTRAEDEDGHRAAQSPEYTLGLAAAVPLWNRNTFLAVDSQVVAPMKSDGLDVSTDTTYVTNVVFTAREFCNVRNLEFQVGAYNLFANNARLPRNNAFYQESLNWPRTTLLAQITYRF